MRHRLICDLNAESEEERGNNTFFCVFSAYVIVLKNSAIFLDILIECSTDHISALLLLGTNTLKMDDTF